MPPLTPEGALTIGEVAERTGVAIATLRAWELRHGFPVPHRLPSGHRRYDAQDVETILDVLRRRDSGVRLDVAIAHAVSQAQHGTASTSVFAELRRLHPDLAVHNLAKPTLIGLSHAIEDEVRSRATRPVLFAAFQRRRHFEPARARWAELARVARAAHVFADFEAPATDGALTLVPLDADAPATREWIVVCDGPQLSAAMVAWEPPGQDGVPEAERAFESIWTLEPSAVRDAARACAALTGSATLVEELAAPPMATGTDPAAATALFHRVLSYLDRAARLRGTWTRSPRSLDTSPR